MTGTAREASTRLAASALMGIGGLHVLWGLGSTWPMEERDSYNDAVIGRDAQPSAAACFAVASALGLASAFVSGRPARLPLRRLGAAGVVVVLGARGVLGVAGRTDLAVPGSVGARFRRLDRRFYGPLCLTLAALSLPAVLAPASPVERSARDTG